MKILCFLATIIFAATVEAQPQKQSGLINYEERFGPDETNIYELRFCNIESQYEQVFPSRKGQAIQTIAGFVEPQIKQIYYLNAGSKKLLFQEGIAFKTITAEEDQTTIDWKITDETKKIGEFSCQKATATYKGNVYSAWFATEIPVPFGPWKLHGLPGLILECSDATNFYTIRATKIDFSVPCEEVQKSIKSVSLKNPVSMKKYRELRLNENEDIFNFYNSISSRDTFLEVESDYTGFMREPLK